MEKVEPAKKVMWMKFTEELDVELILENFRISKLGASSKGFFLIK